MFQHYLLKRLFFLHPNAFASLLKIKYMWVYIWTLLYSFVLLSMLNHKHTILITIVFVFFFKSIFRESKCTSKGWGAERGGERILSRLHAISAVWCGAWTHQSWDHDLSQIKSWTLNRLSHLVRSLLSFYNKFWV